jgi:predicted ATPase
LDFELLLAQTGDVLVPMPWRRDRPRMNLEVLFQQSSQFGSGRNNLTAVIGSNGTGKSHLLSAIVQTFLLLEEFAGGLRRSKSNLPLQKLNFRVKGQDCGVSRGAGGQPLLTVNGRIVTAQNLPLPERVVALTTSPFDKFPIPRTSSHSVAPRDQSLYRYLGLRDRTGRAAIENILFRSLNSLFETSDNEAFRRANIGRVFEFLQLRPNLTVIYHLRATQRIEAAVRDQRFVLAESLIGNSIQLKRASDVVRSGEVSESGLAALLEIAFDKAEHGTIRLSADFANGGSLDENFRILRPLRRAGFLQLRAVEVTHANGLASDLKRASSGQLSMASSLLALAAEIKNGSLVLIDEPELSLHPEWQVKYIDLLLRTFDRYSGCHFVVATHSPLVISELPSFANVVSLDKIEIPSTVELSGQSADFLLAEAFGLPSNKNRHVKEQVIAALRLAADGMAATLDFESKVAHLQRFAGEMDKADPVRAIIEGLQKVADEATKGDQR